MTPTCPRCGSVDVELWRKYGQCQEADCLYQGPRQRFSLGGPETGQRPTEQRAWRDPQGLLPKN